MVDKLKKRAEVLLRQNPLETPVLSTVEVQKLFHELDVYQTELQMRNEELRQAQLELSSARDSYAELFDFAPLGYLVVDIEGRILETNIMAASLLGLERDNLLLGQSFAEFVHRDSLDSWNIYSRQLLEQPENLGVDLALQRQDGESLSVRVESMPRLDETGQLERCLMTLTDLTERVQAEEKLKSSQEALSSVNQQLARLVDERTAALGESEAQFKSIFNDLLVGVVVHAADSSILFSNEQANLLLGLTTERMRGKQSSDPNWRFIHEDLSAVSVEDYPVSQVIATKKKYINACFGVQQPNRADITWVTTSALPVFTHENELDRIVVTFMDITERKRLSEALEKRVLALTRPLDQPEGIALDDLFNLSELQRIQQAFSRATGVASIILLPDGTPITEPTNFTEYCTDFLQARGIGCGGCLTSNTLVARHHPEGPAIQQCPGTGLWEAGASIEIGGRHMANWLIGQVRDESTTEHQVRAHARQIGADENAMVDAFSRVPLMTPERFGGIAQALFTVARHLSNSAYQNVQQARFIEGQKKAEQALLESEEKYRKLFESESDAIMIFDKETGQIVDVNDAASQLYGYTQEEFLRLSYDAITAEPDAGEETIPAPLIEPGTPVFASQHRKKDGTVFPTETTSFTYTWQTRQVLCGVVRDTTERVAYENEREKNQRELRKLASELSMAEQRERERVGRELHDGVSQLLSSSLLRLNVLKDLPLPEIALESLDTICEIVKGALDETRSLTFELSCPMLNELGLAAALDELCSSMTNEYSIRFEFIGEMSLLPIEMDRKIALYRSTRELLINVMKHSGAKWARVHLERQDDQVHISVEDDGRGFNAETAGEGFSPTGGFGLFNLRESIRHAGGNVQIESVPGDGTRVVLSLPLEVQHE